MSYNEESNVLYWKDVASMSDIICRGCNSSFKDILKCKNCTKIPAMNYKGREIYGYTYYQCYNCVSTKLINIDKMKQPKRTRKIYDSK